MDLKKFARYGKFFFSKAPFYTIFYITARCNARCAHCFYFEEIEDAHNRDELSLDEIEKIARNWGEMLILNLAGGEPYLRNDLPEIVKVFKENTGLEICAIPSNGILTDRTLTTVERLLKENPDLFFRFTFSIDGMGEQHDEIRSVPGNFKKVTETVRRVRDLRKHFSNFTLHTNSCFMSQNQDNFMDLVNFVHEDLQVDAINVTYIRGDVKLPASQEALQKEKYAEVINHISHLDHHRFSKHPLSAFILGATLLAREKVLENLSTGLRNFECYAIKKMIVLEDTGAVKVCEMMDQYLGNLRDFDYDINKVVTSKLAETEYKKIQHHEGNCTWECAIRTGVIYNPKEYGSILKHALTSGKGPKNGAAPKREQVAELV